MKHTAYFSILLALVILLLCEYQGSKYNRDDPAYERPSFTIDSLRSTLRGNDTISVDSLTLTLIGNDDELHQNQFRWKMDDSPWSPWGGNREPQYVISIKNIPAGSHTLKIQVCYSPKSGEIVETSIVFFRAVKPSIAIMTDTLVRVSAGASCTLRVKAEGTGELRYAWYRNKEKLGNAHADSLLLNNISLADTGVYYCQVTNAWGEAICSGIRLRVVFLVFYDGNGNTGGTVPVDTNRYVPGALASALGNSGNLTRRGYTFAGWNMKADGSGVSPEPGLKFEIGTDNVTLYAMWSSNPSFTLTYNSNGATGGKLPDSSRLYRTGELITVAGNSGNLVRTGYTFTGWNTAANGSGKGYGANDLLEMGDEAITLYAQWSSSPTFTVTYDGNGAESGKVPVDTRRYEEGDTVTVAGNSGSLSKAGHTFTGWNTQTQGNGGAYTPGSILIMGAKDITLYAQWTAKPVYTLTYHGNGNTGGTPPVAVSNEAGVAITVAGQGTLVKKGHTFTGWNTEADGSGVSYAPNSTWKMGTINDTLYAQWEINRYTITYDGNGSDVTNVPLPTTHRYNTEATLAKDTPTRTGYTFYCWNTSRDGDGEDYNPGDKIIINDKNVTLYARWTKNRYPVIYSGNGNTGGTAPQTVYYAYDTLATIQKRGTLVKSCYSFVAWNSAADGIGKVYQEDAVIRMPADTLRLYAQWVRNSYTVTFNKNDNAATGSMSPQTIACGETASLKQNEYTKTGWSFVGWAKSAGGEVVYADRANYTMGEKNDTLHAKWLKNCVVTFNSQGGSAISPQTVPYGNRATAPSPPTLSNCTFSYWYKEPQCFNKWDFNTDVIVSDTTLYAGYTVTDIDGNVYKTILIGNQRWMAENLKTTRYNDGTPIPLVTDSALWSGIGGLEAYCWYNNDPSNKGTYGALYGGGIVYNEKHLAPLGWHIPTIDEWNTLITFLGDESTAGGMLKASGTTYWDAPNTGATNSSGFTALPGGMRFGNFHNIRKEGYWWANSPGSIMSYMGCSMSNTSSAINNTGGYLLSNGLSIRCVKDW